MLDAMGRAQTIAIAVLASGACGDTATPQRAVETSAAPTGAPDETSSSSGDPGDTSNVAASSSDEGSTTAAPHSTGGTIDLGGGELAPLRVAVLADLNGSYGSTEYEASVHDGVAAVIAHAPDLVLSAGDMVAGQQSGLDYHAMWAGFHAAVSDPLRDAGLPFAITPGNHDASGYPAFVTEREIFVAEWTTRKPALDYLDDTAFPLRYSFVAGPALFVALDDTTVGPLDAEQMGWLDDQLTQGAEHPAKIVFGHLPLWAFAQGREDEIIGDPALEQLLLEHGVALFVSGHHHAYYPGRRGALRLAATACIGAGPRALIDAPTTSPRGFLELEIDGDGAITMLDTWAAPAFEAVIDRADLPPAITYGGITIDRDDG